MRNVQLVTLDPSVEKVLARDPEYMDALIQDNWPRVADIVHRVVGRTLNSVPATVDTLHWGGYIILDETTGEVIGSCAFKAPPTAQGTVEIAYFTFPGFEGQGYAM